MNVTLAWELGHGYGHIARMLSVARAFRRAAWNVSFVCRVPGDIPLSDLALFSHIIPAPVTFGSDNVSQAISPAQLLRAAGFGQPPLAISNTRCWLDLFTLIKPDLVVGDYAPTALLAAYISGIPAYRVGTSFSTPIGGSLPHLRPWMPIDGNAKKLADSDANLTIAAVCRHFKGQPLEGYHGLLSTAKPFLTTWPVLDHLGSTQGVDYYGPLESLASDFNPSWPIAKGLKVLLYLSPKSREGLVLREILARLGCATLWHDRAAAPDSDAGIYSDPFNLPAKLREADIFISRGGHGAACQALVAGCPHIMIPSQLEASLLAYRASRAGVAVALLPSSDATAYLTALETAHHSTQIAGLCDIWRKRLASYDGVQAADLMIRRMVSRSPHESSLI